MLVLTRKVDEAIVIDDSIVVRVIGGGRNRVRLAIEAPPHVRIQRSELLSQPPATPVADDVNLPATACPPAITPC